MKRWKIKYQKGSDILITEIKAECRRNAAYYFYVNNLACDIISIEEVT